jgi:DNA-binding CsgD family transcriptional regulator
VDIGAHEIRFAHPLFAAVVYAITPIHERRRIHRELASLVGGVEEQARHLALGADAPDEAVAQALDRAADNARRRGAPDAAAELAEHARRLTPAGNAAALARRTTLVAQYLFHAGEFAQAEAMLAGVLGEATVGPTRADALRLLADVRAYQRGVAESIELEQEALGHVGDDPGRRAEIELSLSYLVEQLGDFAGAVEHARLASEFARRARDPAILASAIAVAEIAGFPIGLGCDSARIDEALRLEDVNQELRIELRPTLIAALLATYTGELRRSTELLAGLRARVLERGQESDLPLVSEYLAWAECWRGNLSVAEQMAAEAVATSVRLQAPFLECLAQSFAALVAAYAGDDDLTVGRVARTRQLIAETGVQIAGLWGDWSMAVLALSKDDPEAAVDALAPIIDVVLDRGLPEPVQVPSMPDAIEALGGLGELDRARRLLEILEESATRVNRTWALAAASRCRALLVAAHGDIDAASAHASEAVERGERLELRLDLARSLLVAGQIERRRRRKREAERRLARALEIFEEAGARLWAARTRREIDRIGRRPSKHELTETERRVAELAAAGHTNRQVASALFISPKTVEANLSRAYSKLGIHSRAELGARLGTVSRLLDVR